MLKKKYMNLKNIKTRECPGCHAVFPYQEEANAFQGVGISRYGVTSPECIALFCELLGKEREWFGYPPPYRHMVDAYAVQHPPHAEVQKVLDISDRFIAASKQSVIVHLIGLYLMLEKKVSPLEVSAVIDKILNSKVALENIELTLPESLGDITVQDVARATTRDAHMRLVLEWSKSAWQAWQKDQAKIRALYEKYAKNTLT
jgi:hypothetical protein